GSTQQSRCTRDVSLDTFCKATGVSSLLGPRWHSVYLQNGSDKEKRLWEWQRAPPALGWLQHV
ncbi:unnamed protein product, partial [Gulo gulo]